jgi:LemA protein
MKNIIKTLPLFFIVIILGLSSCSYNKIQLHDESVNAGWSEVLNQYQRRADLVPNLVATVKGYTEHETNLLTTVTEARSNAMQATAVLQQNTNSPEAIQNWQAAQQALTRSLTHLSFVSENYPNLKADSLYRDLLVQLEGSENRIAVARGRYIEAMRSYNTIIRQFPGIFIAKIMGYQPKANFLPEENKSITQTPIVNFSNSEN